MPRILLLDDDSSVARAHARMLKRAGLQRVEICGSPTVALERILAGERFDVVLCDGQMPDHSGVAFYQQALAAWSDLEHRIVFLSGGVPEVDRRFIEKQGLPFFWKPLRNRAECDELVAILRRLGLASP